MAGLAYPETLASAWSNEDALRYDPDPRGVQRAREAVAGWYASVGIDIDPAALILTASTSEAYSHLFKLLCDPGDRVLVPCPSYPLFEHLARLDAVTIDRYAWRDVGRWVLDETTLTDHITPRTRALIVVAPNNPTGSVPAPHEWDVIAECCRRHDLVLVIDEVFAAYPLDRSRASLCLPAPPDVLTIRLNGLSKLVGLPQAKLGWMAVHGPATRAQAALDALEVIADTYLSVSTPVQVALPDLLRDGASVRAQILARVSENLRTLTTGVASTSIDVRTPDGGWTAVLRVPAVGDADDLVHALLAHDVLLHPGYFYDLPHDGYLVASLLAPLDDVRQAVGVLTTLPALQPV